MKTVAVLGGAFSGASAALLLRREVPEVRVIVLEGKQKFDRKVGEASTEVSGAFMTKRLGITHHLNNHHILKHGLRFWFATDASQPFDDCAEIGSAYQVRLPSYQLDREVLDEHLLQLAESEGAEVRRVVKVRGVEFSDAAITLALGSGEETLRVDWLIDASGRASFLPRKLGLLRQLPEHPTNSIWARVRNVEDWDGHRLRKKFPRYASAAHVSRAAATNHLTGYGWWCWIIPLKGGDYSVGLVYDSRLFTPPEGGAPGERLMAHVRSHPVGRELFAEAELVEGDVRAYSNLPYYSEQIAGPRWQVVGDAAGFMDPLYSQGLDFCSWTVCSAVDRIRREVQGETVCCEGLNRSFQRAYHGWFKALYEDKYHYLGDSELMEAAFLMDIGLFFFGPVRAIVEDPVQGFLQLPFDGPVDSHVAKAMAWYNRRLAHLAQRRRAAGVYGERNASRRVLPRGFEPNYGVWNNILAGAGTWMRAEVRNLSLRRK